jgi:hypothetical protein
MMTQLTSDKVLAIAPVSRGFAYALFESVDGLVDWSNKEVRRVADKNAQCLVFIERLLRLHRPPIVALGDWRDPRSRRSLRIRLLLARIADHAAATGIVVATYRRADVAAVFEGQGARTKYDIARAAARLLPELAVRVPSRRRPWQSERYQMAIFDAVALGITHYALAKPRPSAA